MFKYTTEGYKLAKNWLISINDYYEADGWSLVLYANNKYERLNNV